jgi:hypothetical protein
VSVIFIFQKYKKFLRVGPYTIKDPCYAPYFKHPVHMILFQNYRLSKSGQYFWHPRTETINEKTGEVTFSDDIPPIAVTPERTELWNKLRGA